MPFDDKTAIISHFIGIFEMSSEAARMRIEYDNIRAQAKKSDNPGDILNVNVRVTSPYVDGGFQGKLSAPTDGYKATDKGISKVGFRNDVPQNHLQPASYSSPQYQDQSIDHGPSGGFSFHLNLTLAPPSSMATVNIQYNWMTDDDVFNNVDLGIDFQPIEIYHTALSNLVSVANDLQLVSPNTLPSSEDDIAEDAISLVKELSQAEAPSVDGSTSDIFSGADAYTIAVNGEAVTEAPVFDDQLPVVKLSETDSIASDGGEDTGPLHEVITGTSTLINQAGVVSGWLDAPVIAVMGDYVSFNGISQVNVYNDFDTSTLEISPEATTHAYNVASVETISNAVAESDFSGGPQMAVVTRIDGNVVNFSHTYQFNFASDDDTVSVSFTGEETFLQLGDNTLVNFSTLFEIGYQYDLIIVGGDMIDLRFIQQTNVLLDSDSFYGQEGFEGSVSSSDNLLWNEASITQIGVDTTSELPDYYAQSADTLAGGADTLADGVMADDLLDGIELLRVLYVSGDMLDVQLVYQTNIFGDADQIALASETYQSADGANVDVIAGSNVLLNAANIADLGVDSTVYVGGEEYSDALLYQAEFISTDDPLSMQDTTDLASEAVLFLADDMIGPETIADDADMTPVISSEPAADVMQSVLA